MASRVTRSRRQPPQMQPEQSRAKWTGFLTEIFADLMVDQVKIGNRLNNCFSKKAWKCVCNEFYKRTGLKWDKEQLKNRYAVLRRQYVVVKSLLSRGDFTWDESTGAVMATDESWAEHIKEHPDAEAIKSGGCPIYKQLCVIFSEPAANGKEELEEEVAALLPSPDPVSLSHEKYLLESEEMDDGPGFRDTVQPKAPSSTGSRKRGRKGIDDAIAGAILEMAAASKMRASALKQLHERFPISECIRELELVCGVDECIYFVALELFDKRNARETFLSLKPDKRMAWLQWKCTEASLTRD